MTDTPTFATFNPTKDIRVDVIKSMTDDLIAFVKGHAEGATPDAQRRAAIAVTNYEQAAMWAVKSLFS